MLIKLL